MKKVLYIQEFKRGKRLCVQQIPKSFIKNPQRIGATVNGDKFFVDWVLNGNLRWWARLFLWIKKTSEIKVW